MFRFSYMTAFQFHIGAIKIKEEIIRGDGYDRFNSILVRLKCQDIYRQVLLQ